jgi:molybdate-binding protein/DNA-binding XRE family transcriptional regulator
VRDIRLALRLSQPELARQAGLTRQAISAIEAGRYVPNTSIALRLAKSLDCRVEDLFHLDEGMTELPVQIARGAARSGRVAIAKVNGRLVAHPLTASRAFMEGFVSADAVLLDPTDARVARIIVPPDRLEHTALLLGCDPSLGTLGEHLARHSRDLRITWLSASSRQALDSIAQGEAHLAGSHLRDPDGNEYNVVHARQALGPEGGLVVALAAWEQGFVVAPGNPKEIRTVADLARPDVRLVNRELGAGCRVTLDELLQREGISPAAIPGYATEVTSHLAVARVVLANSADVGLALQAAAEVCGLSFVPLSQVRFDLVVPRTVLQHLAVAALLDLLQTSALREEIATLPGYEVSRMGSIIADIPPAAGTTTKRL